MTPLELYQKGDLTGAIQALGDELRSNPLDVKRRTFLFELLCFAGSYDRAEKQLDLLAGSSGQAAAGALMYRSALHAERTRQDLFAGKGYPRSEADGAITGKWNGGSFTDLRDADPRVGAHFEVFIAGSYTWIPMKYMERLEIDKPEALRDLLWARARVQTSPEFRLQDLGEVLIPVLAPLSSQSGDGAVQLGRATVWEQSGEAEVPLGQRMMLIDGEEIPLLEIRSITWNLPTAGKVATGSSLEDAGHVPA